MHLYLPRAGRRAAACFAALAALAACDSSSGPRPQVAARLDIVAGNEQEAVVGSELPTALVVKVTDDRGRPVRGQIVNFRVVSGGGGVFAGTAQTNDAGEARERWTLGTSTAAADSQRVEVRAVDAASGEALVFATFRATAKPDVPAGAPPVGPASRTGAAGTVLADSLALRVADKYGNPVPGIDVAWAVASGGGSVSPATSRTDASGVAKARWTLGGATGTQTATGTAAGLPATTFIATVNVGAVARVTIMPRDLRFATLGRQIPITVSAADAFGNQVGGVQAVVVSMNLLVASLEAGTRVQARGNGTSRLIATVQGVSDTVVVTVQQVAASLALSPTSAFLVSGDTLRFRAAVADSGGAAILNPQVTWLSTNPSVVTVNASGLATAAGGGAGTITADAGNNARGSSIITVRGPLVAAAFDAGASHSCAATADGPYCWGSNATRQLGGGGGNSGTATRVAGAPVFAAITGGGPGIASTASFAIGESCGITGGGTVSCWGNDMMRQVGGTPAGDVCRVSLNYSYRCRGTVEQVAGIAQAAQISAGGLHVCAVTGDGQAYCWGGNQYGQLGTSAALAESCASEQVAMVPCTSTAVPVAGGLTFRKVSAGAAFTCGITTDGAAYCWGRNDWQQLGVSGIASSPTPLAVPGGHRFTDISSGLYRACGVTTGGEIVCWGLNRPVERPYASSGGVVFRSVSTGLNHTCALATNGAAYCFGGSDNGELGNGSMTSSVDPVAVSGGLSFSQISVGTDHSCGVQSGTGYVYCWGSRSLGATGNGIASGNQLTPALVLAP